MPLHPILVHIPLALALLLPILTTAMLIWPEALRISWKLFPIAQIILCAALYAAMATGEADMSMLIAAGFPREPAEHHASLAQAALVGSLLLLFPAMWTIRSGPGVNARRWFFVLAQATLAAMIVFTGSAGGALVYEHDAPQFRIRAVKKESGASKPAGVR